MKHTLNHKNSIIIIIFAIISILFGTTGLCTIYNNKTEQSHIIAQTTSPAGADFCVDKIARSGIRNLDSSNPNYYSYIDNERIIHHLNNNEFAILNNATLEDINTDDTIYVDEYKVVENIKISFKATGTNKITWLVVSGYLNNTPIQITQNEILGTDNLSFTKYIDIKNVYNQNGIKIENTQGYYYFTFTYFVEDAFGNVEYGNPNNIGNSNITPDFTFGFYLLNEENYVENYEGENLTNNKNPYYNSHNNGEIINAVGTEPSFLNTEKNARALYEGTQSNEKNFYNYQIQELPYLTFDASKYNISYNKNLGGTSIHVKTNFTINNNKGLLTFNYFNVINGIPTQIAYATKQYEILANENGSYIFNLQISDIGDYIFYFNYLLNINGNFIIVDSNNIKNDTNLNLPEGVDNQFLNWNRLGNVELYIFGFQPFYNNNGTYNELKNFKEFSNYNSDITFANNSIDETQTNRYVKNLDDTYTKNHLGNYIKINENYYELIASNRYVKNGEIFNQNNLGAYLKINEEYFLIEDINNEISFPDNINLCVTDQAPVKLSLYGDLILSSKYFYYASGTKTTEPTKIGTYNNNTRFNDNGYYEVVTYYTYSKYENDSAENNYSKIHYQIFSFKISNIAPQVSIMDNEKVLQNGAYSNQNLSVIWQTNNSPFFVKPYAKVYKSNFSDPSNYTLTQTTSSEVNSVNLEENGHYRVIIFYGANYDNSTVYRFTIDKTNIENIKLNYLDLIDGKYHEIGTITENDTIINSPFVLEYSEKLSGADISVTYSYTPLEESNLSISSTNFLDENKNYINNGYILTGTINNINYYKNSVNLNIPLQGINTRSILNKAGLYIFTLTDSAGNTTKKYVLLDNTSPLILQTIDGEKFTQSTYTNNIVSKEITVYYGTHKAIKLDDETSNLLNNSSCFTFYSNNILIPLSSVLYRIATTIDKLKSQSLTTLNSNKIVIPEIEKFYQIIATDSSFVIGTNVDNIITPAHQLNSQSTLSSNNVKNIIIEMNLDKSLLTAEIYGNLDGTDNTYRRLYDNGTSNRKFLRFTYKSNHGTDYEVTSLKLMYYPFSLEYDLNNYIYNTNYPFSNIGTETDLLALSTDAPGENVYDKITETINLAYNSTINTNISLDGKYVITRTYRNSEQKTYTFVIDRNGIVSKITEQKIIGELLSLFFGPEQNRKSFAGTQFLVKSINDQELDLTTNLLPINPRITFSKYPIATSGTGENLIFANETKNYLALNATLVREYTQNNKKIIENLSVSNNGKIFNIERLFKEGIYTLTLTDNTGYSTEQSGDIKINANKLIIKFEIKNNNPTGTFYTINDEELRNVDSYKNSNIKFVWQNPINPFEAKIDNSNFEVVKVNGSNQSTVYKVENSIATVNVGGFSFVQNLITLASKIQTNQYSIIFPSNATEGNYIVKIHYQGNESDYAYANANFYSSQFHFYIDKTVPNYNLNNLLENDDYLTDNLESFKNYNTFLNKNSAINFENYAFATTSNFTLFMSQNNPQYDTKDVYIRKYNKYTTTDINNQFNLQSLVENDVDYTNNQLVRLRFNPLLKDASNNLIYTKFEYNKALNSKNASNNYIYYQGAGYYEVIEIDEAGNQTVYTILVLDDNSINVETNLENSTSQIISQDTIINQDNFNIENITEGNDTFFDKWYKITINNIVKNTTEVLFKANNSHSANNVFTTTSALVNRINELITVSNDYAETGSKFIITFHNRFNTDDLIITYNTPGAKLMPFIQTTATGFIITLPLSTSTTHLTSFYVYKTVDGAYKTEPEIYDSAAVAINPTITEINGVPKSYSFVSSNGVFKFVFTDNYGRTYEYFQIIGITDVKELIYDSLTQTIEGITYTAGAVSLRYEPKLYSINIYKNGILSTANYINSETLPYITQINGLYLIELQSGTLSINKNDAYVIEFTSLINGEITELKFNYYTLMPTFNLLDSAGQNINSIINNVTSKTVYVTYSNENLLFPVVITGTNTYVNATQETIVSNLGQIANNKSLSNYGEYKLTFTSALGKLNEIIFTIKEINKPNFAVVTNISGQTATILNPSSVKFNFTFEAIQRTLDQYFTNGEYRIELNPDKHLIAEEITDATLNENTKVYRIHSENPTSYVDLKPVYFYDKLIAIHTITLSSNIINPAHFYITYEEDAENIEVNLTGTNLVTTKNPIILHWNQFFGFEGNFVSLKYYYNGNYAGITNSGELIISNSGIYDLYFEDLSGNKQIFGANNYYRLIVLNEVIFTINNRPSINNSIYNTPVTLEMQQTAQYDYRTLTLTATLNGKPYIPSKSGYVYTFNDYGVYNITASATVNEKIIQNNFKFAILNPNTARYAHEYTGASGYEITKIMRDGIDLTNTFKTIYNTATLTSVIINPEQGGVGNYTIYVTANFLGARPSQNFSYNFWINNETPILLSSINPGESTTNDISLTFNRYLIFSQIGECGIYVNGNLYDNIDANTSALNEITTKSLTENDIYLVQLKSNTGNTILSFVITKVEPLNAIAIIIIVVASLLVITLIIIFFRLRTRMKVK